MNTRLVHSYRFELGKFTDNSVNNWYFARRYLAIKQIFSVATLLLPIKIKPFMWLISVNVVIDNVRFQTILSIPITF